MPKIRYETGKKCCPSRKQYGIESTMPEEFLETYNVPIPVHYLDAIQTMLRQQHVFCACNDDADYYDILTYRREQAHHHTKIYTLFDRNVLADVLALARPAAQGLSESCGERGRIGAAIMVFLQCSNVIIEPSVALYENPATADDDFKLLRRADNVATEVYLQIALSLIDYMPPDSLPPLNETLPVVDFTMRLRGRQKFRIALMKIAELDVSPVSPEKKMELYLRWCHEEFCFLASPTLLAVLHFTPHRQLTILRNLKSPDRQRVLDSIQNAVWDIHVVFEWSRRVKTQNQDKTFWLLCSRDAALKRIARILHADGDPAAVEATLADILKSHWGEKQGAKIHQMKRDFAHKADDPVRSANQNMPPVYLDEMERKLEKALLNWKPGKH
jgi:hypothetical protein